MSRKKTNKRKTVSGKTSGYKTTINDYPFVVKGMTKAKIEKIFSRLYKCRILVVGDIMLDRYLWGDCSRISPEAPVPVVEISKEEHLLGGAANVSNNISALNGQVDLVGVVGKDTFATALRRRLKVRGFSADGIFTDSKRPTTVKTRIIAQNQQIVRADREQIHEISARLNKKIQAYIENALADVSAVIISDYGKGVINPMLLESLIEACIQRNIFVAVDPKQTHFFSYRKVSTITPNHHEAGFVVGKKITDNASLEEVGWQILDELKAKSILITLGEEGMALFENGHSKKSDRTLTKIPTMARKVYDVTGAGDTVIATLTMAVAAGASLKEAAFIANVAAGEVVAEIGTAQVNRDKLKELVLSYLK
ncbi:MAG: D-glycero-beta-D-manno-heptose-7-phosphate kinase [candidate division Zixibacteria bacterium]|nr:D-glycero-beta-D-manno-heptose-7-phosphate kinase [candidate division Zixibacteria bacterium]